MILVDFIIQHGKRLRDMDGLMKVSGLKVDYLCYFLGRQVIFVSFNQFFNGVCVMESLKSGNTLPRLSGE